MVDLATARGMQVITSDGELIGTVADARPDGLTVVRLGAAEGEQQTVPGGWIEKIDRQVHLNRSGAEAVAGWRASTFTQDRHAHKDTPAQPGMASRWIWLLLVLLVVLAVIMIVVGR